MKLLCLAVIALAGSVWANEDILLDFVTDAIHGDKVERRAVWNAVGSASITDAARNWAGNLGWNKVINSPVSKSFEDSCLGTGAGTVSNPSPWLSGAIKSPNSWSSGTITNSLNGLGKREQERLANRDVIFVLDSSGSIPNDQFEKAKKAINILIESFCPSKLGHGTTNAGTKQISVVVFDSTVTTEVDFSESSKGVGYLQDKILSIKHRRGSTATGSALNYVRTKVLGKGRSRLNDPKVSTDVIVITDGQCNVNCQVLGSEANAIRKMGQGVNLSAMGVAKARACELEIITGQGHTSMAYGLGDFSNFDRFAAAVKEIAQENASKCA